MTISDVPPPNEEKPEPVTVSDIKRAFITYITTQSSMVGRICNAHMAYADFLGANHKYCIHLAELHADAIDCVKNGNTVALPPHLINDNVRYPHYMGYPDGVSYESSTVCGKIYNEIHAMLNRPAKTFSVVKTALLPHHPPHPPALDSDSHHTNAPSTFQHPPNFFIPLASTKNVFDNVSGVTMQRMLTRPAALPYPRLFLQAPPHFEYPAEEQRRKAEMRDLQWKYAVEVVIAEEIAWGWHAKEVTEVRLNYNVVSTKENQRKYICVKAVPIRYNRFSLHKAEYDENSSNSEHYIYIVIIHDSGADIKKVGKIGDTFRSFKMGQSWSKCAVKIK